MRAVRSQYYNSGRWYRTRSGDFDRYPLSKRLPTTADLGHDLREPMSRPEHVRRSRNCNLGVQSHDASGLPCLEHSLTCCLTSHEVTAICLADYSPPLPEAIVYGATVGPLWFWRGFRRLRCRLIETGILSPERLKPCRISVKRPEYLRFFSACMKKPACICLQPFAVLVNKQSPPINPVAPQIQA